MSLRYVFCISTRHPVPELFLGQVKYPLPPPCFQNGREHEHPFGSRHRRCLLALPLALQILLAAQLHHFEMIFQVVNDLLCFLKGGHRHLGRRRCRGRYTVSRQRCTGVGHSRMSMVRPVLERRIAVRVCLFLCQVALGCLLWWSLTCSLIQDRRDMNNNHGGL